jgi:hypothetical protein
MFDIMATTRDRERQPITARRGRRGRPPVVRTPKDPEVMTDEDLEVLMAVDRFRQRAGTHFCTVLQIFEVIRGLGYERTKR